MDDFYFAGVSLDNLMKRFKGDAYRVPNGYLSQCMIYEYGQKGITEAKYRKYFESVKSLLLKSLSAYNRKNKSSRLHDYENKVEHSNSAHDLTKLIREMLDTFNSH